MPTTPDDIASRLRYEAERLEQRFTAIEIHAFEMHHRGWLWLDLFAMQLVTFQRVDLASRHSPLQQYVRMLVPQPIVVSVESLGDQRIVKLQEPSHHEQRAEARIEVPHHLNEFEKAWKAGELAVMVGDLDLKRAS